MWAEDRVHDSGCGLEGIGRVGLVDRRSIDKLIDMVLHAVVSLGTRHRQIYAS